MIRWEDLYDEDEALFDKTIAPIDPDGRFGSRATLDKRDITKNFYVEQAIILNALNGTPVEDDFGPVDVPEIPATPAEYFKQLLIKAGTYASRTKSVVTVYDAAKRVERFVLERMYERIDQIKNPFDDGL